MTDQPKIDWTKVGHLQKIINSFQFFPTDGLLLYVCGQNISGFNSTIFKTACVKNP